MKNRLCALFFGFLFLGYSVTLNAGAYEQLLGMTGSSPVVPEPTYKPVSGSNNDNSQTPYYGPFNIFKPESPYEKEQRLKREAVRREQRKKQRKEREAKRAKDAQRRRWAREDREEERERAELEKKRRSNKHLNKFVPPPPVQRAVLPSLKSPVAAVKKGSEAKAFAENKFRIATLLRKTVLSEKEKKILKDLYDAQIKLFKQALLNESLTDKERALIKLDLPVLNTKFSDLQKDFMNRLNSYLKDNTAADKNTVDFIKLYNYDKMQQLGEYALTEAYENIGLDDTFENMVGALKISAAIEKDGYGKNEGLKGFVKIFEHSKPINSVAGGEGKCFIALDNRIIELNDSGSSAFIQDVYKEKINDLAYANNGGVFFTTDTGIGYHSRNKSFKFLETKKAKISFDGKNLYVLFPENMGIIAIENAIKLSEQIFSLNAKLFD